MIFALSLVILIGLALFSILLGNPSVINVFQQIDGSDYINDEVGYTVVQNGYTFGLDPVIYAIILIVIFVSLVLVMGIGILGSGLNSSSITIGAPLIFYIALWFIFNGLTYHLFVSIPIFGIVIFILNTFLYTIGLIQHSTGGIK